MFDLIWVLFMIKNMLRVTFNREMGNEIITEEIISG